MRGMGDYSERSGHIVVLGWQEGTTLQTLRLINAERRPGEPMAVLVAKEPVENPAGDSADFVRSERLSDPQALTRAGAPGARALVVRGANDDETLAAVLIAESYAPNAHVVAYFSDERTAETARERSPRIEAIGSLSEELLSRSARDPGSSNVAARLLSASSSDTAYTLPVPVLDPPLRYIDIFTGMKRLHGVTIVGLALEGATDLNCPDDRALQGGEKLYYISGARVDPAAVRWSDLKGIP